MIWQIDLLLFVLLVVTGVVALVVRDLLAAVAVLAAYSLFVSLLFVGLAAVDVAFVEAALGAGFVGLLFVAAVLLTGRRQEGRRFSGVGWVAPAVGAFIALMLFASTGLPDRGDPDAPAHQHVSPFYIERSLPETETPNIVTAVLADFRSHDTFGETLVIVTAGLATLLVLARRDDGHAEPESAGPDEPGAQP